MLAPQLIEDEDLTSVTVMDNSIVFYLMEVIKYNANGMDQRMYNKGGGIGNANTLPTLPSVLCTQSINGLRLSCKFTVITGT